METVTQAFVNEEGCESIRELSGDAVAYDVVTAEYSGFSGRYERAEEQNGFPSWKKADDGKELYCTEDGRWTFSPESPKRRNELNFTRSEFPDGRHYSRMHFICVIFPFHSKVFVYAPEGKGFRSSSKLDEFVQVFAFS